MIAETGQKIDYKKPSGRKYIIAASLLILLIITFLFIAYFNQGEPEPDLLSETLILKEAA